MRSKSSVSTSDKAPRVHKNPERQPEKGLVMVYTGDGKGKTTAAMGMVIRALGHGVRVAIVQFIKGSWPSGEEKTLKKFKNCQFHKMGEGFTWDTKNFKRDSEKAQKGLEFAQKLILDSKINLVVLDEINCCLDYNFLKVNEVLKMLRKKHKMTHILLTGRGAPEKLMQFADLVTEMKCVKHPYKKGIWAQRGVDY